MTNSSKLQRKKQKHRKNFSHMSFLLDLDTSVALCTEIFSMNSQCKFSGSIHTNCYMKQAVRISVQLNTMNGL